jgi:hypothetical protein
MKWAFFMQIMMKRVNISFILRSVKGNFKQLCLILSIFFAMDLFPFNVAKGQTFHEYTIGADNLGNYGMQLSGGNDKTLVSFSYSTLNIGKSFNMNKSLFQNYYNSQMSNIGLSLYKQKPLSSSVSLYYGGDVNLASNPFKNNSSIQTNNNYLTNFNLNVGVKYQITKNMAIGAEVHGGYGNSLLLNTNNFFNFSPFNSFWLNK